MKEIKKLRANLKYARRSVSNQSFGLRWLELLVLDGDHVEFSGKDPPDQGLTEQKSSSVDKTTGERINYLTIQPLENALFRLCFCDDFFVRQLFFLSSVFISHYFFFFNKFIIISQISKSRRD